MRRKKTTTKKNNNNLLSQNSLVFLVTHFCRLKQIFLHYAFYINFLKVLKTSMHYLTCLLCKSLSNWNENQEPIDFEVIILMGQEFQQN